jgi:hypothetical protein
LTYAAASIVIGGAIGACYWVVTSAVFGMHQDAFSALAIKDYKNFLRMKFEENRIEAALSNGNRNHCTARRSRDRVPRPQLRGSVPSDGGGQQTPLMPSPQFRRSNRVQQPAPAL